MASVFYILEICDDGTVCINPAINANNVFLDVCQIRKKNLLKIESEVGGRECLSEKTGVSYAQLTNYLSAKAPRKIGHAVARRIEAAVGKPFAWMDQAYW